MKDIPIIFSAPMVLAQQEGRKTNTRRFAWGPRFQKAIDDEGGCRGWRWGVWRRGQCAWPSKRALLRMGLPPDTEQLIGYMAPSPWQSVKAGDRLWVRENLTAIGDGLWKYAADKRGVFCLKRHESQMVAWAHHEERGIVPSIHMLRIFSRLTLIITATKIERLKSISRDDAIAEGLRLVSQEIEQFFRWPAPYDAGMWLSPPAAFFWLWDQLHGAGSSEANPEVVAISFSVHKTNIDAMPKDIAA